jgi:hypothetical protein
LLANWLIPLSSALLVWLVRSFSHPRYVVMFVPGLILLAAYLIFPGTARVKSDVFNVITGAVTLLLLVLLTTLSLWGLALYFFDDQVAKDDIRGAARYLEETAAAQDLILVPDTDWSLPFEYRGQARVAMPGLQSGEDYWKNLVELTADSPRVFTLDYERGTRDWQNLLPFALHSSGTQHDIVELGDLQIHRYDLDKPLSAPVFEPVSAQFGPLQLSGVWVEQDAPAGDALAVALQWQWDGSQPLPPVSAALRLVDEEGGGRVTATADDRLLDHKGRPSDQWPSSQPVSTYHLLPLPAALPPLSYTLDIEVYVEDDGRIRPFDLLDDQGAPQGQTYRIPGVQTARGAPLSIAKRGVLPGSLLDEAVVLAPGLSLEDAAFSAFELSPGSALAVELLWQADEKLPDLKPALALVQGERILAEANEAPANGRYPTSSWEAGEQVLEVRDLRVPSGSNGSAKVILTSGDQEVHLGDVSINEQAHTFVRPRTARELNAQFADIARLVGFDLEDRVYSTAEKVPITLLWESLLDGDTQEYVVFVHLLADDGRLIGQHDGVPAQGQRPVSGWVAGEYILDPHEMLFRDLMYAGTAVIEVGLYNPLSGERVRLQDGSDHLILPVELAVEAGE